MERDHLEDLGVWGRIIVKGDLPSVGWEAGTGLMWLRIGTGVRIL